MMPQSTCEGSIEMSSSATTITSVIQNGTARRRLRSLPL